MSNRTSIRGIFVPLLALLWAAPAAAQQGTGTVSGQVADSASRAPLVGAELIVTGDAGAGVRTVRTGVNGRYTVAGLAPGAATVSVRLVGFAPRALRVTVRANETVTADFFLPAQTARLDQVVVTGTGGVTQRRAVGNVVESIDAKDVMAVAPARSVQEVIGARTPGLIVLPAAGQVGTGAQLRVRGVGSLSLSNDPIIYIDGVRMDAAPARGPVQRGGGGASRLNDINPEDIQSIEVIKGPAASTLYGTEASNGVIQIITKRGRTGKPQFNFTTRQGANWLANPEGRAGLLYGRDPATQEIISFNLYRNEIDNGNGPIFTTGQNQGYQAALNGGTDANRYYIAASWDHDVGVVPWNWNKKFSGRANVDILASNTLRLQGSIGHIRDRVRLAQQAIDVDPFSQLRWGTPLTRNTGKRGFLNSPPEEWKTAEAHADNDRTTLSLTMEYSPMTWFTNRLITGLDVGAENNWTLYRRQPLGSLDFLGQNGLGAKNAARTTRSFLTLDYSGNVRWGFGEDIRLTSSVGLQAYRSEISTIGATANTFPAIPITTITGGATRSGTEDYLANATVGMFVQQQVAWKNRVFVTAAVRGDDNSAFGKDFSAAYYPKVSASWVVSEEPWFKVPFLGETRLRGALGAAGTQPGTFDASRLYDPSVGYQNNPGLIPSSFGNPALKPERSQELELGFETTLLNGRADVSYTHYGRDITDAIVNVPIPPSAGFPGSQVVNIGKVSGWGNELAVNVRLIEGRRFAWEMGTQLASNGNRIEDMGGSQFLAVGGGGQAQNRVGYGIADFFMYKLRSAKIDDKGTVLESICDGGRGKGGVDRGGADVPCSQAPRVYWGHSQPTWQLGVNTSVSLWEKLRLYARVDGNGGHIQSNTEIRALHNQGSTLAVIKRDDPFLQVYRAIEADAPGTYRAGFLRLREVSASYNLARSLVQRIGASNGSLTVGGRNLMMLWTQQDGWGTSRDGMIKVGIADQRVWDPEIRAVGQLSNGYQTILPPTVSFVTTLRLTF
ncbi:MAG TPA: SusC/RagA family TonB-linked outer membrane protein [Gemmatimonadaceae bacterium]|nr:SusC/RagA family TonB-linked outer membrane protein [Gemmatimonadaceae bacterium]